MHLKSEVKIIAFTRLGALLRNCLTSSGNAKPNDYSKKHRKILSDAVAKSCAANQWFIEKHVWFALHSIGLSLTEENIRHWHYRYNSENDTDSSQRTAGVVMAGNIPVVGFHDFFCVLMANYNFLGKLSNDDMFLLPAIAEILMEIEPCFAPYIHFTRDDKIQANVILATGSDNTNRYFEHLYGAKPHIFRKNRHGVAVLTGKETDIELKALGVDLFMHFGLGCRNVSQLFLPQGYDFNLLNIASKPFQYITKHDGYSNNLRYFGAFYNMIDRNVRQGPMILIQSNELASPVSVLNFEYYDNPESLNNLLKMHENKIQCVVGSPALEFTTVDFGKSQVPMLVDFADGVDTFRFLMDHSRKLDCANTISSLPD